VPVWEVFLLIRFFSLNIRSYLTLRKMKRLLLVFSLFFAIPVSAAEITSKITDSVQLSVQGAAVQSQRMGAVYGCLRNKYYNLHLLAARLVLEHMILIQQVRHLVSQKVILLLIQLSPLSRQLLELLLLPIFIVTATTQLGGDKGTLAGTLSPTGVPTVTAGGSGTTATGQRTIELSVFK
jgi:hypothetical protein